MNRQAAQHKHLCCAAGVFKHHNKIGDKMDQTIRDAHAAELRELDDAILLDNANGEDGSGHVLWASTRLPMYHVNIWLRQLGVET